MEIEVDLGSGLHQSPCTFWKHVGVFPESVLIKESALGCDSCIGCRIVIMLHRCHHVMNDLEALCRFGLDRLDVSILSETGVYDYIDPAVWRFHWNNNVLGQLNNEIGSDVPLILIFELPRRRHICRISLL